MFGNGKVEGGIKKEEEEEEVKTLSSRLESRGEGLRSRKMRSSRVWRTSSTAVFGLCLKSPFISPLSFLSSSSSSSDDMKEGRRKAGEEHPTLSLSTKPASYYFFYNKNNNPTNTILRCDWNMTCKFTSSSGSTWIRRGPEGKICNRRSGVGPEEKSRAGFLVLINHKSQA